MTDKLKKIIKDEIVKLPLESQEVINSLDWAARAEEIGKKYLLDESEVNDLQVETLLVLTGMEDGSQYALNIENNVGTSKGDAEKIAEEVTEKIFTPISDTLIDKIKQNLKNKKPDWKQSINFVLSDGDYSAFMEQREENSPVDESRPLSTKSNPK